MTPHLAISIGIYLTLSAFYLAMNHSSIKIQTIDLGSFFFIYVLPTLAIEKKWTKIAQFKMWVLFALVGIFAYDALSSLAIVKRELFMGWFIMYPIGIFAILFTHTFTLYLSRFWPNREATRY